MSGPKHYSFPTGSPEEAAGILSQFSAFQRGVRATVSGNQINVTVSNAAWCAGKDYDFISEQISEAKKRFRRDEEMQRILKVAKDDEVKRINGFKVKINKDSDAKRKRLMEARGKCTALCRECNVSYRTPFGVYTLDECMSRIESLSHKIDRAIEEIAQERTTCLSNCEAYVGKIHNATSLSDLSDFQRNAPDFTIAETFLDRDIEGVGQELNGKKKQLVAFVQFLEELDRMLSVKGLSKYKQRVAELVSTVDIYSPSSIKEILHLVEQIERENSFIQEQMRVQQRDENIEREVSEQMSALHKLKNLLKPLSDNAEKNVETQLDYESISKQALYDCEKVIREIKGLEFCSGIHLNEIDRASAVLDRARGSLRSPNVFAQLTALLTKLKEMQVECKKEAESYSHFAVELEKYKELYMKFRAILSAEDSEINDDDGYLEAPTDIVFSYSDREMQIAVLAERNTQLQGIVNESIQQTFCAGMSAILSDSKWGSEFKREKRSDDSAHLSYVRKANKGSVFDITCDKNGGISIAPMGVILSNGKATISADELRQVHSSCAWADEIGHTFEEIGIPNGSYEEMDATEREKLYDKKNYYKIVTDEESIRFLRLSGYSDEEIEKLGYSVINEEQDIDVSHSSTTQIAKAKEIKP